MADPIDNLKNKEQQEFTKAINAAARPLPTPQQPPATPAPPPELQQGGGSTVSPQPFTVDPNNLPTGTPNYIETPTTSGGFNSAPLESTGGGATTGQVIESVLGDKVRTEQANVDAFNAQSDANVAAATQELIYPALYSPPDLSAVVQDFANNTNVYRTWVQQQQALNDEQTNRSQAWAQEALDRLARIPPPSGSATEGAFGWVEKFLGLRKDASDRQYMDVYTREKGVNIPATLLYSLGLAQNLAMGAGIDLANLGSKAFNALPPWLKSGAATMADGSNPVGWLANQLVEANNFFTPARPQNIQWQGNKLNDGKSNFIEAIRGAQYGFSDDKGVGFGTKEDKGFRVGMPPGRGFGFDVNPSLLAGLAVDVFVGAKVDKLIKFGRLGGAALPTPQPLNNDLRNWQRGNITNPGEPRPPQPGAPLITPPPAGSAGRTAQEFQQLEFTFMQNVPQSPAKIPAKAASTAQTVRQIRRTADEYEQLTLSTPTPFEDLPEAIPPARPQVSSRVRAVVQASADEVLQLKPGSTIAESPHIEIRTPTQTVKATATTQKIAREIAVEAAAVAGKLPDEAVDVIKAAAQVIDDTIPELVARGVVDSIDDLVLVLDDLPALVVDDAALQGVANVVNATIRNNALGEIAKAVGIKADDAVRALNETADIGRKFVGDVPKVDLPPNLELPRADSFKLFPATDEPLFHGTRVVNHTLKGTDPIVGGARNELGTAHYLTTDSNVAEFAAKADSATNLPGGVNREIGSPNVYDVKLSPESKLVDAKAPSSAYNDLAKQLGVDVGDTPKSLVQVLDEVSQRLDEAEALTFQRQFTEALRSSGIDGARAGNTIAIYNPAVIVDELSSAVGDSAEVIPKLTASLELAADSVKQTGSEFSKAIAADANMKLQSQTLHELKYLLNEEAQKASDLIDTSGLWDDIEIPGDKAVMHPTGYVLDYVSDATLARNFNDVLRSMMDSTHPGYIFREFDDWHITVEDEVAHDATIKNLFSVVDRVVDDVILGDYIVAEALERLKELRSDMVEAINDSIDIYKAMNAGIDYAQFPGVNLSTKFSNDFVAHYDRATLDQAFQNYTKLSDNALPLYQERGMLGAVLELYRSTRLYKIVNQFLASKDVAKTAAQVGTTTEKVIAGVNLIGALDVALLSMPKVKQTLYRRVPDWDKAVQRYPVGQVVETPTFISVASAPNINNEMFGDVKIIIKDGVGHKLLFNPQEGEILIPRNQRFYVESADAATETIVLRQLGGDSLLGVNAQGLWKEGKKLMAGVGFSETSIPEALQAIYSKIETKVWNTLGKIRSTTPPKLPANTTLDPLIRPLKDVKSFLEQERLNPTLPEVAVSSVPSDIYKAAMATNDLDYVNSVINQLQDFIDVYGESPAWTDMVDELTAHAAKLEPPAITAFSLDDWKENVSYLLKQPNVSYGTLNDAIDQLNALYQKFVITAPDSYTAKLMEGYLDKLDEAALYAKEKVSKSILDTTKSIYDKAIDSYDADIVKGVINFFLEKSTDPGLTAAASKKLDEQISELMAHFEELKKNSPCDL